jgi:hypothetical protein
MLASLEICHDMPDDPLFRTNCPWKGAIRPKNGPQYNVRLGLGTDGIREQGEDDHNGAYEGNHGMFEYMSKGLAVVASKYTRAGETAAEALRVFRSDGIMLE